MDAMMTLLSAILVGTLIDKHRVSQLRMCQLCHACSCVHPCAVFRHCPAFSLRSFCGPQTNNPRKIQVLSALGVDVVGRVPCIVKAQEFNEDYMATKAARMSHELTGDYCVWNKKFYDGPLKPGSLEGEPMPPLNGSVANGNGSGSAASHAQQMSEADGSEHDSSDTDVMVSP